MCGIAGLLGPGSPERDALVDAMTERLRHRGPDEAGHHHDAHVALGMRRLAIQDVRHGHQPAYDEARGVACVLNGEIYNVSELRELLRARGHRLASESDTDCLPHLYEEFGLGFVEHLRGMFALALWDSDRRRLVLARDRLGKKPLFYREQGSRLSFASELKSLLVDPSLARRADPVALSHYLTLQYVPAPWSAIEGVNKLPPAHMLVAEGGVVQVQRYWSPAYVPEGQPEHRSDDELVEELREQLLDAVGVRLVGERPLGAFLSGGLDSSAVVAAMSQVSDRTVRTFSIGFEDAAFDELPYARRVAELFGTEHHELVVRPQALDLVPRLATMFDEPYADSSAIPSWYLAEMASRSVVVAMNGDGGDEVLAGYTRYQDFLGHMGRTLPPRPARSAMKIGTWLRLNGPSHRLLDKVGSGLILYGETDPARRYARQMSYFRPEEKDHLFTADFAERVGGHDTYDLAHRIWNENRDTDPVNRLLAIDTQTYLPGDLLPKVDITTMSVGLEARSPFLDQQLFEWAAGIPGARKLPGGNLKALLKGVLKEWLPDDLLHRRKQGFAVPLAGWLRGPLRPLMHDVLLDRTAAERGVFRPEGVRRLVDEHLAGVDRSNQLYAMVMLELWFREVLAN